MKDTKAMQKGEKKSKNSQKTAALVLWSHLYPHDPL